jgi:DNA-binding NtrC family response regulator
MEALIASDVMRSFLDTVARVASANASVLITGESGCGKELIARALHCLSRRAHRPWVDVSCAALPENLIESELFGHEKGAFSGADSPKPGLFEMAHTGTIFLDEIGELDPKVQVKLLRVLDAVPYFRLGGTRKVTVDVRVVAATNRDLESGVREGSFRSDLFHRLNQLTLHVPALRDRVADIAPLAQYFLAQQNPTLRLLPEAIRVLEALTWPGNVRELRNEVTKAAVLAQGQEIGAEAFAMLAQRQWRESLRGLDAATRQQEESTAADLKSLKRSAIFEALRATGGHHQKAAARLGISRRTLSRKLKLYENENAGSF